MTRNKSLYLTTALLCSGVLALTACSSAAESQQSVEGATPEIVFIPGVLGDEFYISMECAIVDTAGSSENVTVQGAEKYDPTLQKPVLDSVIASKPDAIVIAATDGAALNTPLSAAADSGTKVVLVDSVIDDADWASAQVASDNVAGGAEAFNAIADLHPEGGKVLVVGTDPGVVPVDQRVEGFEEAVAESSDFEYLGVQYSHNEPAEAARIVTAALAKDPDIVGIFAANTFAAEGTAAGLEQAGMRDSVDVIGFDASPALIKQLENGTVQGLIAQDPAAIGSTAVEQVRAALAGDPTEALTQTGFHLITADDLESGSSEYAYKTECG